MHRVGRQACTYIHRQDTLRRRRSAENNNKPRIVLKLHVLYTIRRNVIV